MPVNPLRFNKVCEVEDFSRPELADVIRDLCAYKIPHYPPGYPTGSEQRKDWEMAMALRTLDHFGAVHPGATILGVAAGAEDTSFYLTRSVKQVFATDRYVASGDWETAAPLSMLVQPEDVSPIPFDPTRLVTQHMDGRLLRYPDDTFDAVFSSSSVEHFGEFADVAASAYEMGRVLKPGGILSLSTEIRLAGPPGGIGWPGRTLVFSPENLRRFVVEASGLEPVDDLEVEVSEATMAGRRDLTEAISQHAAAVAVARNIREEYAAWEYPHIVLVQQGYVFTSVHLALRKTEAYPSPPNSWAKPTTEMIASIEDYNRRLIEQVARSSRPAPPPEPPVPAASSAPLSWEAVLNRVAGLEDAWIEADRRTGDVDLLLEAIDRHLTDVDSHVAQTHRHQELLATRIDELADWPGALSPEDETTDPDLIDPRRWSCSRVDVGDVEFDVLTDPRIGDPVSSTLAAGRSVDVAAVGLMLALIQPGDRVLDIGAHLGTFSLAAAAAGAQVVAIEASAENAALLRTSIARNGFERMRVIQAVASDQPGVLQFAAHGPWGQVTLADDSAGAAVAAVSIDDLLEDLGWHPVSFVKIDVEGWEPQVLNGMRRLLSSADAPALLYECNGHTLLPFDTHPEELVAAVERLGYTSYLVGDGRLVRVSSDEFQPATLIDYLAVKAPPKIAGWRVEPELSLEERVQRIVADSTHPNHAHRLFMARALERAGPTVLAHPIVRQTLERLRDDPVEAVRHACAWWDPAAISTESRQS